MGDSASGDSAAAAADSGRARLDRRFKAAMRGDCEEGEEGECAAGKDGGSQDGGSEEEEESDPEDDSDEEEDEDEEEEKVGIALSLPKRSTRGSGYARLLKQHREQQLELLQLDDFWAHSTWQEESGDDAYCCSEGESQYEDTCDSDFDAAEADLEEEAEKEAAANRENGSRRVRRAGEPNAIEDDDAGRGGGKKKKSFYQIAMERRQRQQKRKLLQRQQNQPGEGAARVQKPLARATRQSLRRVLVTEEEALMTHSSALQSCAAQHRQPQPHTQMPLQEELLRLADLTEAENVRDLTALRQRRELRQLCREYKRASYKGHYCMHVSWASYLQVGPPAEEAEAAPSADAKSNEQGSPQSPAAAKREIDKTAVAGADKRRDGEAKAAEEEAAEEEEPDFEKALVIFTDGKLPELFQQLPAASRPGLAALCSGAACLFNWRVALRLDCDLLSEAPEPLCALSGRKASFFDPLTRCFYASAADFKALREAFHRLREREVASQLWELEVGDEKPPEKDKKRFWLASAWLELLSCQSVTARLCGTSVQSAIQRLRESADDLAEAAAAAVPPLEDSPPRKRSLPTAPDLSLPASEAEAAWLPSAENENLVGGSAPCAAKAKRRRPRK